MELHSITVSVENIDLAIDFYTKKLYFKKKKDISKIHKKTKTQHRKVSLVSTKSPSIKIIFSTLANSFKPLTIYRKKLFNSGVPYLKFSVHNLEEEYKRLSEMGVKFSLNPQLIGLSKIAVFSDECGNHIQINEDV
ncbi:MAG: hypothetical protein CMD23_01365 [Flavobacteriales bacterium]|nr:hypothetical protein [Flavobacteriales bacterium]